VAPGEAPGTARCPICGQPAAAETRPLCSPRCKEVDLGRWLGERYAIPAVEPPDQFSESEDEDETLH
jgi:hypothetical protein|tara:strand:+ start:292 stop:492 length:201 start_codon:yes stop_codon:yes gene_type:complete